MAGFQALMNPGDFLSHDGQGRRRAGDRLAELPRPLDLAPCTPRVLRSCPGCSPLPALQRGHEPVGLGPRWPTAGPSSAGGTGTGAFAGPARTRGTLVRARAGSASRPGWRRARARPGPVPVLTDARRVTAGPRPGVPSPGAASGSPGLSRDCASRTSTRHSSPRHRSGGASHPSGALAGHLQRRGRGE